MKPITRSLGRRRPPGVAPLKWFASYIRITAEEPTCWTWDGQKSIQGYGRFTYEGRLVAPHRWAWEQLVGVIPEGFEIDHACQQPLCVNPAHLQVISREQHQEITSERRRLHKGAQALPGVEGVAALEWRAEPWAKLPSMAALAFAQEHRLPFYMMGGWRSLGSRETPRHVEDRETEARLKRERASWLAEQGLTEETYQEES